MSWETASFLTTSDTPRMSRLEEVGAIAVLPDKNITYRYNPFTRTGAIPARSARAWALPCGAPKGESWDG
jgi:hypothetical protein